MAFITDNTLSLPANPAAGLVVDLVQPKPAPAPLPFTIQPTISITSGVEPSKTPVLVLAGAGLVFWWMLKKR